MWGAGLDGEGEYKLNLWDGRTQAVPGCLVSLVPAPATQALSFFSQWDQPSNSVDQRVKMSAWLDLFEERRRPGIYHTGMTSHLARLAPMYDLTIIPPGKREPAGMFHRDASRSGSPPPTPDTPGADVAPRRYARGMAGVVGVNDPVSGQGANNASHSAAIYGKAIRARGDLPFDQEGMQATFDEYWQHARSSIALT